MNQKHKIGYLLGAGASANSVPIVSKFRGSLLNFREIINDFELKDFSIPPFSSRESFEKIKGDYVNDIQWLLDNEDDHYSIDTFARKLYLQGDYPAYRKLKLILNELLIYIEHIEGIDKRYDAFFAALLDKDSSDNFILPDLTILTWNYDRQVELSLAQFLKRNTKKIAQYFNFLPKVSESKVVEKKIDGFLHVKLNGSVGYMEYKSKIGTLDYNYDLVKPGTDLEFHLIRNSFHRYYNGKSYILGALSHPIVDDSYKYDPIINFSWESPAYTSQLREIAYEKMSEVDVLVIIGYSFPTFNRLLDSKLFNSMSQLEKIYLQIPESDIEEVEQRMQPLIPQQLDIQIIRKPKCNEFFIPFEL